MKPTQTWPNGQGLPYAQNQESSIKAFEFRSGTGGLLAENLPEIRRIGLFNTPAFLMPLIFAEALRQQIKKYQGSANQ